MKDPRQFTSDVFQTLCEWFEKKKATLETMVGSSAPFRDWIASESFLACKAREATYPFCEVAAGPSYASEGVGAETPFEEAGDLRVGGPGDGANHCWVFVEFAFLGKPVSSEGPREIDARASRLLRLGWKKSSSLLVVVLASHGDPLKEWAGHLANCGPWNRPALARPFVINLPGGGSVAFKAIDIKRDPADTITPGA